MTSKKFKQSKIIQFLVTSAILVVAYFITYSVGLRVTQFGYDTLKIDGGFMSAILFFVLFIGVYKFIFHNKKIAKFKNIQRIVLYSLFLWFSAVALNMILNPIIQYMNFLRFKISGVNLEAISASTSFFFVIALFATYTIFTILLEMKNNKNGILKHLIYWCVAVVIASCTSLFVLFFFTGLAYPIQCLPKTGTASDYCYSIGESIYQWWIPVPGSIVFVVMIVFITLYFKKAWGKNS